MLLFTLTEDTSMFLANFGTLFCFAALLMFVMFPEMNSFQYSTLASDKIGY